MSEGRDDKGYFTACDICGKKFYGYDNLYITVVDGRDYCPKCTEKTFVTKRNRSGRFYMGGSYYRIAHTLSSMYDGPKEYCTTLEAVAGSHNILFTKHCPADPMLFNWGFGLSGHIDSEHWEVYTDRFSDGDVCFYAFVFEPSPEELAKLRRYERSREASRWASASFTSAMSAASAAR